jgi:HD superfamily phosphodiesterase
MENQFYVVGVKYGFGWSEKHSKQVINLGHQFYDQVVAVGLLSVSSMRDKQVIQDAGYVHDIGRNLKAKGIGEHNEKSVTTLKSELGSTTCADEYTQVVLYCVRHHRGDDWRKLAANRKVPAHLLSDTKRLCGIFRIADALDHGLQERVRKVSLILEGLKLTCYLLPRDSRGDAAIAGDEKLQAKKKADLFKEAFGLKEVAFEIAKG